jgi:hypothetical protein
VIGIVMGSSFIGHDADDLHLAISLIQPTIERILPDPHTPCECFPHNDWRHPDVLTTCTDIEETTTQGLSTAILTSSERIYAPEPFEKPVPTREC